MTTAQRWGRPFFKGAKNKPEVIAHRGGAGQWPGETLFAFEQALSTGVDVIEMDVHSTDDGALVLLHNPTVDETTNGHGPVNKFKLKELQELDAGYRWTADGGKTFPFRGRNIRVPTLEEILLSFPGQRMNIEIKQKSPDIVEPVAAMIRQHKMEDKVLVASFSHRVLKRFRLLCPEVATSASGIELIKFVALAKLFPGAAKAPDADAIQVRSRFSILPIITKKIVSAAHRHDLPIHGWTVNEVDEMRRLIDLNVDGIITDFPGRLLAELGRNSVSSSRA
jgi:glycerophosphoryl diester phosphodiesterase